MIKKIVTSFTSKTDVKNFLEGYNLDQFPFFGDEIPAPLLMRFTDLVTGQLVVSRDDLVTAKEDFRKHYKIDRGDDFAATLMIPWQTLEKAAVESKIDFEKLVIYCIHRLDVGTGKWFLTLEFCEISGLDNPPIPKKRYDISHSGVYYDLKNGTLAPQGTIAVGDADYYTNVRYSSDGNTFGVLNTKNTRACSVCWNELQKLYDDNFKAGNNVNRFSLCFSSATCNYSTVIPDLSYVSYPHLLLIYSNYDNIDLLENGDTVSFYCRAGDYQTLCPPNCNIYIWPNGL